MFKYISLGMKLTKVNRIWKFNQSDWLKIYIDFNTKKEIMLSIAFQKTFLTNKY